jgi:hypothetical protein
MSRAELCGSTPQNSALPPAPPKQGGFLRVSQVLEVSGSPRPQRPAPPADAGAAPPVGADAGAATPSSTSPVTPARARSGAQS